MEITTALPNGERDLVASSPSDLSRLRQRIAAWRASCLGPSGRMPDALWRDSAARKHGVERVADTLGLSLAALQRRLEATPGEAEPKRPAFLELGFLAKPPSCELEILSPDGAKLTVRVPGPPSELCGLVETFLRRCTQ